MVRPMDNSHNPSSGRADAARVTPYLTHLVTHHGQLTLIPPQNAGRIRKTKGKVPRQERRRDNEEPRFNIAAPVSSRRAQTDSEVPDYPPPSFSEAIATPPPFPLLDNPNPRPPDPANRVEDRRALPDGPQQENQIPGADSPERPADSGDMPQDRPTSPNDVIDSSTRPNSPETPHVVPANVSQQSIVDDEPDSANTSPETSQGSDTSNSSSGSDISSLELVSLEPSQQWEADRQLGLSWEDRVERERFRQEAARSTTALVATPKPLVTQLPEQTSAPKPGPTKRPRYGTLKSLQCSLVPSSSRTPSGSADEDGRNGTTPGSPQTQSRWRRVFSPSTSADQSSSPVSPTFTPLSPLSAMAAPWASRTTLVSEKSSPKTPPIKRKESVVFRKLFHVKGKDKDKEKCRESPPAQPNDEELECWEVVDPETFQTESYHGKRFSRIRRESDASTHRKPLGPLSPTSPAFLTRAVRPIHSNPPVGSPSPSSLPLTSPTRAATSPTLRGNTSPSPDAVSEHEAENSPREKSKARRPPPPPPPPRRNKPSLRQSPSVVWKTNEKPVSPPQTPTLLSVNESPTTPTRYISPPPPVVRPRASSALPSLSMPPQIMISNSQQAEPFPLSEIPSPPCTPTISGGAIPLTPSFVRPTLPSLTTISIPQTPNSRHYAGRPLPQPPQEHSPLGRPIYPLTPAPTPQTPQQQRHRSTPAGLSQFTDLDALVSRTEDGPNDGRHYEDLLLISEIAGNASPSAAHNHSGRAQASRLSSPSVGRVEVERRRVTKEGRIRLKLTLLGVTIDKCGICLSQFKDGDEAAMGANCQHA
ncbi:hypothetical protein NLI96_g10054 [Meripilus lineatus]|uniref:Uncharacterized protein n=1 Tax=Meripilus lineatus TaxID=2056292 RepID=A0AAD5UW27_9APHY|nr:hypothetical protein NLI96_g10054 [Physisporinus lineatus]